jgi:hypothetical protein
MVSHAIFCENNSLTGADTQGDGTKATVSLQAELKQCVEAEENRATKRRREDKETALVIADLKARLKGSEERADNAEAEDRDPQEVGYVAALSCACRRALSSDPSIRGDGGWAFVGCHHLHGGRGRGDGARHRGLDQRAVRAEEGAQA